MAPLQVYSRVFDQLEGFGDAAAFFCLESFVQICSLECFLQFVFIHSATVQMLRVATAASNMCSDCVVFVWQLSPTELNRNSTSFCCHAPFLLVSVHPCSSRMSTNSSQKSKHFQFGGRVCSICSTRHKRMCVCIHLCLCTLHAFAPRRSKHTFIGFWQKPQDYSYIMWVLMWHHVHRCLPGKVSHTW